MQQERGHAAGCKKVSILDHEEIMEEAERCDRLEYDDEDEHDDESGCEKVVIG